MLIDEGKVNFGDESPDREEIENLTSEEEDVDIEGIETVEWVLYYHWYYLVIFAVSHFIVKTDLTKIIFVIINVVIISFKSFHIHWSFVLQL